MSYIAKQQFDYILYLFRTVLLLLSQTHLRVICSDISSKLGKPVRMLSLNVCQLFKHYIANKDITNARQLIYQHLVIWFSGVTIIYPHYFVTWNRSDVPKNNTFNSSKKRGLHLVIFCQSTRTCLLIERRNVVPCLFHHLDNTVE